MRVGRLDQLESGAMIAVAVNLFCEHGFRPNRQLVRSVQRSIDDQLFSGFGVHRNADHRILFTFEVPVSARRYI